MNIVLKKMSAFLLAAATLSTVAAPFGEDASAIYFSPLSYSCNSTYIPGETSFTVEISKSNGTYYLVNNSRNLRFVNLITEGHGYNDAVSIPEIADSGLAKFTGSSNDITKQKLATLYHVEEVYDWYAALGYSSFGAYDGAPLYVCLASQAGSAFCDIRNLHKDGNVDNNNFDNLVPFSMVAFGEKGQSSYQKLMAADRDVVGHEMTHLVVKKRLGWYPDMKVETQALMEAYCDILGELSDDSTDWKIGYDSFSGSYCMRDLANPSATRTPNANGSLQTGSFYTNYSLLQADFANGVIDSVMPEKVGDRNTPALASTVISHTAYLMNKYGISRSDLAKIWYNSLSNYGDMKSARQATFEGCRFAVTIAANDYFASKGYTAKKRMEMLEIVNNAFDSANIYLSASATRYINYPLAYTTTRQNLAANSTNMSDFVRATSQKYLNGKYWNGEDVNTYTNYPTYLDLPEQNNGITVCPTFYKGYDKSFDYAEEDPYYECAGFAKKLQTEYFGTTKFLQLNSGSGYTPRIGDHLRISQSRGPAFAAHSIFITRVSGSSITYVDCNASGDQKIKWNQTGTITKTNGIVDIKLGNTSYNFVWVERPLMLGDVNGDSIVNQSDVTLLKRILSYGTSYSPISNCNTTYRNFAADVNKDGKINSSDVTVLTNAINSTSGIHLEFIK